MHDQITWVFVLLLLVVGILLFTKAGSFFWDVVVGGFIDWLDWLLDD